MNSCIFGNRAFNYVLFFLRLHRAIPEETSKKSRTNLGVVKSKARFTGLPRAQQAPSPSFTFASRSHYIPIEDVPVPYFFFRGL